MSIFHRASYWTKLYFKTHPTIIMAKPLAGFFALVSLFSMSMFLLFSSLSAEGIVLTAIYLAGAVGIFQVLLRLFSQNSCIVDVCLGGATIFTLSFGLSLIYTKKYDGLTAPLLEYVGSHPAEFIVAIMVWMLTWSIGAIYAPGSKIKPVILAGSLSDFPKEIKQFSKIGPWSHLSDWDAKLIAAHEAGHAIALGLFPYVQKDCQIVMQMGVDKKYTNGYCRTVQWSNQTGSMSFHEIEMIILLAGVEAELLCIGERGISGTSDYERFIEEARQYLLRDHRSVFFYNPLNEHEVKHNTDLILDLKRKYQNITRNLLVENRDILDVLREKLLEKGIVKGEEFHELVAKVKRVPGCPVISPSVDAAMKQDTEYFDDLWDKRSQKKKA